MILQKLYYLLLKSSGLALEQDKTKEGTSVQYTLKSAVSFAGVGLHSGQPVRMTVRPASADYGIWFRRTDVIGLDAMVPAIWSAVTPSKLCTVVENEEGVSVSTIEHIMAALAGCGIHNALIDIDGPEVPILDGSAEPFVAGFLVHGLQKQIAEVRTIRVLRKVEVTEGEAIARLEPSDAYEIDFKIDFAEEAIGQQSRSLRLTNGAFVRELSDSRTFCRQADVDFMQTHGLALGGTLENAVVVDGDRVLSPGGLRYRDEPVRHKMLDALGDLALAGGPIQGRYTGIRAGHAMTNRLLRQLFATPGAWIWTEVTARSGRKLPGAGVTMADLPTGSELMPA